MPQHMAGLYRRGPCTGCGACRHCKNTGTKRTVCILETRCYTIDCTYNDVDTTSCNEARRSLWILRNEKSQRSHAKRRTKNLEAKGLLIRRDAPSDRRSQLLYPTKKAESLRSSKAEIEAAFYEYLTNVLTAEEAAAFAAALNKLYTASKTESRAGFPHFRKAAGGEAAHEKG